MLFPSTIHFTRLTYAANVIRNFWGSTFSRTTWMAHTLRQILRSLPSARFLLSHQRTTAHVLLSRSCRTVKLSLSRRQPSCRKSTPRLLLTYMHWTNNWPSLMPVDLREQKAFSTPLRLLAERA